MTSAFSSIYSKITLRSRASTTDTSVSSDTNFAEESPILNQTSKESKNNRDNAKKQDDLDVVMDMFLGGSGKPKNKTKYSVQELETKRREYACTINKVLEDGGF